MVGNSSRPYACYAARSTESTVTPAVHAVPRVVSRTRMRSRCAERGLGVDTKTPRRVGAQLGRLVPETADDAMTHSWWWWRAGITSDDDEAPAIALQPDAHPCWRPGGQRNSPTDSSCQHVGTTPRTERIHGWSR